MNRARHFCNVSLGVLVFLCIRPVHASRRFVAFEAHLHNPNDASSAHQDADCTLPTLETSPANNGSDTAQLSSPPPPPPCELAIYFEDRIVADTSLFPQVDIIRPDRVVCVWSDRATVQCATAKPWVGALTFRCADNATMASQCWVNYDVYAAATRLAVAVLLVGVVVCVFVAIDIARWRRYVEKTATRTDSGDDSNSDGSGNDDDDNNATLEPYDSKADIDDIYNKPTSGSIAKRVARWFAPSKGPKGQ